MQNPHEIMPLEQLLQIALEHDIIDGWTFTSAGVSLELGTLRMEFDRVHARVFLRGLIRGFERAQHIGQE